MEKKSNYQEVKLRGRRVRAKNTVFFAKKWGIALIFSSVRTLRFYNEFLALMF
jgi:hypothetical protein